MLLLMLFDAVEVYGVVSDAGNVAVEAVVVAVDCDG